jgi:proteasome assembly chaperone (PAC2) family protein
MNDKKTMPANLVKLRARPKLNSPVMLASWPGISNVAPIVTSYLKSKLVFKELGEIDAAYFFDPIGVLARNNVVEAPQFPMSRFYYAKNPGPSDLILFVGDDQPTTNNYQLANCVLDVAVRFKVKRVYTFAAALTRIHHTEPSRVWGVASSPDIIPELKNYNLLRNGDLQIAGLNGTLLGVARERGIEGICLVAEVPSYTSRIDNPMAALAIIRILNDMLGVKVDLGELAQQASETRERLKEVTAQAMGEYIDYFTTPIWESGEEGEEFEDEDGDEED